MQNIAYVTNGKYQLVYRLPSCSILKTGLVAEKMVVAGTPGGYSSEFVVGGVPPGSPNPDPILDQNMPFSIPVFRPGL